MGRWFSNFLVGLTLVGMGHSVLAEEDPFGPPPPASPESVDVFLPPAPRPNMPAVETVPSVLPRAQVAPPSPTAAQKRVQERAATAALQRKARLQQRKSVPQTAPPLMFPVAGPLSHPALFRHDPGIAIAFRPITLSGLDPLPTMRPVRSTVRKRPQTTSVKGPVSPDKTQVPPVSATSPVPPAMSQ